MIAWEERDAARQLRPADLVAEGEGVEEGWIVAIHSRGQNRSFPRVDRDFEAFELMKNLAESVDAAQLLRHVLPREKESREVGDIHRLDFGAEAVERVSMDAREQAAIAPLVRSLECAAQNRTLRFAREERGVRFRFRYSQGFGQR